ncbi:MAG: urate hydroxylase PuuD [Alphaproteobacteria bacterium]
MADLLAKLGLDKLERAVLYGIIIAAVLAFLTDSIHASHAWGAFFLRWLHVLAGVMWIGLLWYFNFVQIPSMPKIPDEQKPAVSKVIAPTALFWFRWAALATVVTGLLLALANNYLVDALLLRAPARLIGIGMWLGLIMAFNVWFIIWPNQQKALGLVEASADEKKAAARIAMLTSRFNTMFSVPMLYFMVGQQNLGG